MVNLKVSNLLICIPESFNMNISHQLFDHTTTFVNTNSKGDFKDLLYTKLNPIQIWYDKFNQ